MQGPGGVLVMYGPKAVGKSALASALARHGVHHIDPDVLVMALLEKGREPDPHSGWLAPVEQAVRQAVVQYQWVAVEATGAWDSDWTLADQLAGGGVRVVRAWVTASLNITLARLAERATPRVFVAEDEVRRIYDDATRHAKQHRFDIVIDTDEHDVRHSADLVWHILDGVERPDPM